MRLHQHRRPAPGRRGARILPTAASAFGVFLARQFILAIPRELVEAARFDGAGHLTVFTRIVLPLCRPLIAVLFLVFQRYFVQGSARSGIQ